MTDDFTDDDDPIAPIADLIGLTIGANAGASAAIIAMLIGVLVKQGIISRGIIEAELDKLLSSLPPLSESSEHNASDSDDDLDPEEIHAQALTNIVERIRAVLG